MIVVLLTTLTALVGLIAGKASDGAGVDEPNQTNTTETAAPQSQ